MVRNSHFLTIEVIHESTGRKIRIPRIGPLHLPNTFNIFWSAPGITTVVHLATLKRDLNRVLSFETTVGCHILLWLLSRGLASSTLNSFWGRLCRREAYQLIMLRGSSCFVRFRVTRVKSSSSSSLEGGTPQYSSADYRDTNHLYVSMLATLKRDLDKPQWSAASSYGSSVGGLPA